MHHAERRRCPRFPLDVDCVAEFSRVYREVKLRNASMHGALIEARNLAVHFDGPDCTLRICCNGGPTLDLPAIVARGNAEHLLALRWLSADMASQKNLRRFIWASLGADQLPAYALRSQLRAGIKACRPAAAGCGIVPLRGGAVVAREETLMIRDRPQHGKT